MEGQADTILPLCKCLPQCAGYQLMWFSSRPECEFCGMLPMELLAQQCQPALVLSSWPRGITEAVSTLTEGGGVGASWCLLLPCMAGAAGRVCMQRMENSFFFFPLQPLMWSQTLPGSGTFPDCPSSRHRWSAGSEPRCHAGHLRWLSGRAPPCHTVLLLYPCMKISFLTVKRRLRLQKPFARCLLSCPA